jgi:hypothetical protein
MSSILVISSCTKRKKAEKTRAVDLYQGVQHLLVKKGVSLLREQNTVDWYIISAKYGLISEHRIITPYERSFTTMTTKQIRQRSRNLEIEKKLRRVLSAQYDTAFFLLGERYLTALDEFLTDIPLPSVFFTTRKIPGAETVPCGREAAKKYGKPLVSLKGYLFLAHIKKEKKKL